ncbi:hypothetical protein [Nocardia sp. NPDC051750]|uniref:hypothetical protein n=1 Tax=Nocardia sp. NPDC051750 TaxID=3364325 RepID=UPI00379D38DE
MFVGRTDLLQFVDQLVDAPEGEEAPSVRPLLTVEGCGGSGRTAMLNRIYSSWRGRTPTVLVRPLERPYDSGDPIRPVLAAIMLGLTPGMPGYSLAFPRTMVAQIAIDLDFSQVPVADHRAHLRAELNRHRHGRTLVALVDGLVAVVGDQAAGIGIPGVAIVAPAVVQHINEFVVRRLVHGTWLTRITWQAAVPWFGHQDLGLHNDPEDVLIRLALEAASSDAVTRRGMDDLVLGAFLADLRESAARIRGRRPKVLVLLDDGDARASVAFLGSLLRIRRSLAAVGVRDTDPLAVVAGSSGLLAKELARDFLAPEVSQRPPNPGPSAVPDPAWLRLGLPDLSPVETESVARQVDSVTPVRISGPVHRLTDGHPATTSAVLDRIRDDPRLVADLDSVLDAPGPGSAPTFQQYLLEPFVRALSPQRTVNSDLSEALVTISAARNKREAKLLLPALPPGIDHGSVLFESSSLWTPTADESAAVLPPVVRALGLRILAARTTPPAKSWDRMFRLLYAAAEPDDRVAKLYYKRLLQGSAAIADELAQSLGQLPSRQWLSEFDQIASAFDPRRTDHAVLAAPDQGTTAKYRITVLLAATAAFESDPRVTTREQKAQLCGRISGSYWELAAPATDGDPFRDRSGRYQNLAAEFQ